MELVLPMYNVHPYFSLNNFGKKVHIVYGKMWYFFQSPHGESLSSPLTLGFYLA